MTRKVTLRALAALATAGAGAFAPTAAVAAPATFYVRQPTVTGVSNLTPESAVLSGAVDTGGSSLATFTLGPGTTELWENSFNISNSGASAATEYLDGIPRNGSTEAVPKTPPTGPTASYPNNGADDSSQVLFQYDPVADYNARGGPGSETGFAPEVDVPTAVGLSAVSVQIGSYPAATGGSGASQPLLPGTKYYYWIAQQAGATNAAESYNTYNGTTVTVNPTYGCMPTPYAAVTSPYSTYTATGTITGGTPSVTEPQIQGPCVFYYGGSNNYYQSPNGTFTTPKLGTVSFATNADVQGRTATLSAKDSSVEPAKGSVVLTIKHKGRTLAVASGAFGLVAGGTKLISLELTTAGVKALGSNSTSKSKSKSKSLSKLRTKLVYTTTTDQPTSSKAVWLIK